VGIRASSSASAGGTGARGLAARLAAAWLPFAATLVVAPALAAASSTPHSRIAFERFAGPNFTSQVATVNPDGGHLRTVTHFAAGAGWPDFAPRGGRLVFEHFYADERPGALFTMGPRGGHLTRISSGCNGECLEDTEPAWSQHGRRIAFSRVFGPIVDDNASEIDLMVMRRDGTQVRTVKSFDFAQGDLEPHAVEWSPGGKRLALMLLDPASPRKRSAIFTLKLTSGDLKRITPFRLNAGNPAWSRSGARIAFNSNFEGQATARLFTVHPNGSDLHRLTENRRRSFFEPTWKPNGRQIAFVAAGRHVAPHIVRMRQSDRRRHLVTSSTDRPGVHPDWGRRP
jgi:Tol biopolymer transport system component